MKSHDLADDPVERELERRAQQQAEEDDLRQRMDALSAQEKPQLGTTPQSSSHLRGQGESHEVVESRLERPAERQSREQAVKDDLRQRMDALSTQDKASDEEADRFAGRFVEESEAHARGKDKALFDRTVARDRMDETWCEAKDRETRKEITKDYEAKCAAYYGVEPADRNTAFVFLDGMDKDVNGAWSRSDRKYTLNAELLDEDTAGRAANTVEHECSHRADFETGHAPVHYFSETPRPPEAEVHNGGMAIRPGEDAASYATRYDHYAHDYDAYISNWDKIGEKDVLNRYVDPPDAPCAPDPDISDTEGCSRYNALYAKYESGWHKYSMSDGERQARQHEWRWWK